MALIRPKYVVLVLLAINSLTSRSQDPEGFEGRYDFYYAVKDTVEGRNLVRVRFEFKEINPMRDLSGLGFMNLLNEKNRQVNLVLTDVKRNGDTIRFTMKGPGSLVRKCKIVRRKQVDFNQYVKRDLILIQDKGFEDMYLRNLVYHFGSKGEELSDYEVSRSSSPVVGYMSFERPTERSDLKAQLLRYVYNSEMQQQIKTMEMANGPFKPSAQKVVSFKRRLKELEAQKQIIEKGDF